VYTIQKTTVSEIEAERARIEIQISDHKEVEHSEQSVVFSVVIDHIVLNLFHYMILNSVSGIVGEDHVSP